mgnify:CR=1 FL=1
MLTLDACKALKEMGYPQEGSHFRWYWWGTESPLTQLLAQLREPELSCPGSFGSGVWYDSTSPDSSRHEVEWVACPSEIEALDLLEKEKGYPWGKMLDGVYFCWPKKEMITDPLALQGEFPSDLILAIYQHWLTQQAKVNE